ncbi:unnamed protein product [Blepharisma stoltei]|uniref:Maturase K n=1 Tax=Blepharisma stoltei TaxID=1481888 RepID=A0AAU9JI73_9CILI|nr:unnamed protein product [Blepharisma stoltei]
MQVSFKCFLAIISNISIPIIHIGNLKLILATMQLINCLQEIYRGMSSIIPLNSFPSAILKKSFENWGRKNVRSKFDISQISSFESDTLEDCILV